MITTMLKILSLFGILLVLILYIKKVVQLKKTEDGAQNIEFGKKHAIYNAIIALIANFLNIEGIGTHAVNAVAFKLGKSVSVSNMPGTMNIGAAIPCCLAAYLFCPTSSMDETTLLLMVIAALVGAFIGSSFIVKLNTMGIRLLMGIGMLILGTIITIRSFKPMGLIFSGSETQLQGGALALGIVLSLIFGALMNIGVGYYAPCLAFCSLLGLSYDASMTIMLLSVAVILAFGCAPKMIASGKFDIIACLLQFIMGSIAVLIACFLIKSIHIGIITIVVALGVIITGILFLSDYKSSMNKIRK